MKKTEIGRFDGFNYIVRVPGLESIRFYEKPWGRQLEDRRRVAKFKEAARSYHVQAKRKATLAAVKKFITENKPVAFYAQWRADAEDWKDDSVQVWYIKQGD